MTAHPAAANPGSSSFAMSASRRRRLIFGALSGVAGETIMSATAGGIGVRSFQRTASLYACPAERSLAASHATSNQGWCCKSWTKR